MQNTTFCKHCATVRHVGENTMMEGCTVSRSFSRLLRDGCRYFVALAYDMRAGQPLASPCLTGCRPVVPCCFFE